MPIIAKVAVNDATIHFDKLYSYLVPDKPRMAVVLAVQNGAADPRLKTILAAAPEDAHLTPSLLELVHFLRDRYFCTWYEAVKAIIPYGAQYQPGVRDGKPAVISRLTRPVERVYTLVGDLPEKPKPGPRQQAAVALLRESPCTQRELEEQGISRATLDGLCRKGVLRAVERYKSPAPCRAVRVSAGSL